MWRQKKSIPTLIPLQIHLQQAWLLFSTDNVWPEALFASVLYQVDSQWLGICILKKKFFLPTTDRTDIILRVNEIHSCFCITYHFCTKVKCFTVRLQVEVNLLMLGCAKWAFEKFKNILNLFLLITATRLYVSKSVLQLLNRIRICHWRYSWSCRVSLLRYETEKKNPQVSTLDFFS